MSLTEVSAHSKRVAVSLGRRSGSSPPAYTLHQPTWLFGNRDTKVIGKSHRFHLVPEFSRTMFRRLSNKVRLILGLQGGSDTQNTYQPVLWRDLGFVVWLRYFRFLENSYTSFIVSGQGRWNFAVSRFPGHC